MFADDTILLASSDFADVKELENSVSLGVSTPVYERATYNQLPLNCCKTKTIPIDPPRIRKHLSDEDPKLNIQI